MSANKDSTTLEVLARMVNKGFAEAQEDRREIKERLDHIEAKLDSVAFSAQVLALTRRVEKIEEKVGL